jgi:hypothetical protein
LIKTEPARRSGDDHALPRLRGRSWSGGITRRAAAIRWPSTCPPLPASRPSAS